MIVVMAVTATEAEVIGVKSQILAEGLTPHEHQGVERTVIAVVGEIGSRKQSLMSRLSELQGVVSVTPISRPFKLTSREFHAENTVIRVLDAVVGDGSLTIMAGPCSVESREQVLETALRRKPKALVVEEPAKIVKPGETPAGEPEREERVRRTNFPPPDQPPKTEPPAGVAGDGYFGHGSGNRKLNHG